MDPLDKYKERSVLVKEYQNIKFNHTLELRKTALSVTIRQAFPSWEAQIESGVSSLRDRSPHFIIKHGGNASTFLVGKFTERIWSKESVLGLLLDLGMLF